MGSCPRGRKRFWSDPGWCNCKDPAAQALQAVNILTSNPQNECNLFNTLPGEIRTLIYEYVLEEQESEWFGFASYHRRPDYPKNRYIETTLLRTCRRIYLETQPMVHRKVSVIRFWLGDKRRGPSKLYPRAADRRFSTKT
jgi:hypothetical protein